MLASCPFFLAHIVWLCHLWGVRPNSSSWVFWFFNSFDGVLPGSTLRMVPTILRGDDPGIFWWDFCYVVWSQVVFLFSWVIPFLSFYFISACLMMSAFNFSKYLQASFSPSILISSWFSSFIPSFLCHLPLFIISCAHFWKVNEFFKPA